MTSRKALEKELFDIRKQLDQLASQNEAGSELLSKNSKADETSANLLSLLKFMIDENRKTTMLLKSMSDTMSQLTSEFVVEQDEEEPMKIEELPISGLDASIIQFIQVKGLACADDIKGIMNYRGRNAASARLNNLFKRGVLHRYQLGHKVYYKFDAGNATNTLIVSPPH